ncbi:MAG TPA: VCBS repeat-containing protein [Pirellulaceae bacterium]|nr:VCBS repeat-containing protein [Pirellulaceae bacterium]
MCEARSRLSCLVIAISGLLATATGDEPPDRGQPWRRHTIDDSARGADGVRLADVNGDGHLDIATGWEEAGLVRLYLNPGPAKAKERWPAVTVGEVKSPEDAVAVDLDGDGNFDVVSCCEGNTRSVFVHWGQSRALAPRVPMSTRGASGPHWETEPFPALAGQRLAMYCLPMQIDGEHGIDLVIGSKGKDADVGWLRSPKNPRDLPSWTWHPLTKAGWIMSLVARDMDGDGDEDVLVSDRKGANRGVYWLERPEPKDVTGAWKRHDVPGIEGEVMFLDVGQVSNLSQKDSGHVENLPHEIIVPTYDKRLWLARSTGDGGVRWDVKLLPYPDAVGKGKSAAFADLDLDGKRDIVLSTENYEGTSGLVWLSVKAVSGQVENLSYDVHEISGTAGPKGLKFDRLELIDLDGDGDLDVLTTEERTGWGVVWFENPAK